jgi:NAD(P)-dependent dehydrogenase (short-subunit alcohol dehydrogenase family)
VLRSIGAVLAGLIAIVVLSIATDMALRAAGLFPPLGQLMSGGLFLLATAYRTAYGVLGGYLTARLAQSTGKGNRPVAHAVALGVVGLVVGLAGALSTWNKGPEFGPHWYPLALVVLAISALVNNAGVLETQMRVDGMDLARLQRVFATNVFGAFACAHEAVRRMSTRYGGRGGAIVNVSSAAARLGLVHHRRLRRRGGRAVGRQGYFPETF